MSCRHSAGWMDRALDEGGAAPPPELAAHLHSCDACRETWRLLRAADTALRAPRPESPPAGMLAEFHRMLETERGSVRNSPRRPWWVLPAGALAGAGALATWFLIACPFPAPGVPAPPDRPMVAMAPPPTLAPGPAASAGGDAARAMAAAAATVPVSPPPAVGRSAAEPRERPFRIARIDPPPVRPRTRREYETAPSRVSVLSDGGSGPTAGTPTALDRAGAAVSPAVGAETQPQSVPGPLGGGGSAGAVPTAGSVPEDAAVRLAVDFDVSPAVLSAMVRTVDLPAEPASLEKLARELTLQADVPVLIQSGRAGGLRVTPVGGETQLWYVLDTLARQSNLEIVPSSDRVVLRERLARERRQDAPAALGAVPRRPAVTGSRSPTGAVAPPQSVRAELPLPAAPPDRTVWPEEWGTLPERGFVPPSTDEFLLFKVHEQQQNPVRPVDSPGQQVEKRSVGQPRRRQEALRGRDAGGRSRR